MHIAITKIIKFIFYSSFLLLQDSRKKREFNIHSGPLICILQKQTFGTFTFILIIAGDKQL